MWYNVDHNKLVVMELPDRKRKMIMVAYLRLAASVLAEIANRFNQKRLVNIYKMQHNGQICYLRGALNDAFDPQQRRILIGDRYSYDATYIYTEAEAIDRIIYTQDEVNAGSETLVLHPETDLAGTSADFKVLVPADLDFNETAMRAVIDFYKLAGKRYSIDTY